MTEVYCFLLCTQHRLWEQRRPIHSRHLCLLFSCQERLFRWYKVRKSTCSSLPSTLRCCAIRPPRDQKGIISHQLLGIQDISSKLDDFSLSFFQKYYTIICYYEYFEFRCLAPNTTRIGVITLD